MLVMFGYPLFYNVWMSVTDFRVATFLTGVAPFVGFDNYLDLFGNRTFYSALWLTGIFTVISIAGQMTIGMLLALFFWRPFPLNSTMRRRGCCRSSFRRRFGSGCSSRTTASSTTYSSTSD
jgi:multiple sugar transport system permease protein